MPRSFVSGPVICHFARPEIFPGYRRHARACCTALNELARPAPVDVVQHPGPKRRFGALNCAGRHRVFLETRPSLGNDAPNPWEGAMAKGILVAAMDFSAAPEDEFHDWYDLEHVPERLQVPGFLNGDRWIGADNPKISVATYDLDNVGVLKSP